jgi:hypothetical protein
MLGGVDGARLPDRGGGLKREVWFKATADAPP